MPADISSISLVEGIGLSTIFEKINN
ncbi:Transcriptional regulator [Caenorhabditis elegans]|uniref:Transcriptional regulator n=1 Tax=Caenorhabditis elegans TaxID=6239 RepID=A0A0S4XR86_CAEEL|nr:Transcriptional regulator [Caenorhabditis elegans]CUV67104.1 Transcriptional regulator [Caenorhabditis elegans]|eukprot:NP_001305191.1 Uncharacterized protein CELE_K08D9.10 [Caenorhabditis elegans]